MARPSGPAWVPPYRTDRRPAHGPWSTSGRRPPTEARGPHVRGGPVEPALTERSTRRSSPASRPGWRPIETCWSGTTARTRAGRRRTFEAIAPPGRIWEDGPADGETISVVAARVDRVIAAARGTPGDTLRFAHGHVLRILGARWIGLPPEAGALARARHGHRLDPRLGARASRHPPLERRGRPRLRRARRGRGVYLVSRGASRPRRSRRRAAAWAGVSGRRRASADGQVGPRTGVARAGPSLPRAPSRDRAALRSGGWGSD